MCRNITAREVLLGPADPRALEQQDWQAIIVKVDRRWLVKKNETSEFSKAEEFGECNPVDFATAYYTP